MKVLLDLPEDVHKLVEYIPGEILPSILLDIIRKDIKSRSAYVADDAVVNKNSEDISRLMAALQSLVEKGSDMHIKQETVAPKQESKPPIKIISDVGTDIDDDFMDMLK